MEKKSVFTVMPQKRKKNKNVSCSQEPRMHFSEQRKREILSNIKRNWYFTVSAMAFFCLYLTEFIPYQVGLFFVFVIVLAFSSQVGSVYVYFKKCRNETKILSFLTALGICLAGQQSFTGYWNRVPSIHALEEMLPVTINLPLAVGVFGAVIALYFICICVLVFWNSILKIFSESKMFHGIKPAEWVFYGMLFLVLICFMAFAFTKTDAFYGTNYEYDIIYTSDSPNLVRGNVYLVLTHPENDLRQPLFAVFSAPFFGIPYLLARLIGATPGVQAILINSAQILLLFAANIMLTRMMKLDFLERICFISLLSCTYMQLLFTLMMEQYIVAYFWLVLCINRICEKQHPDRIALWGAGGTLLTSMIFLPFMSHKSPIREPKAWLTDMIKYGSEFVLLLLVFGRFEIIWFLWSKITGLMAFCGQTVTWMDKVYQYFAFICNCFAAPVASAKMLASNQISWQLNTVASLDSAGCILFMLVLVSAIWNRDKRSSLLCTGWVAFSLIMLLVLGWGTQENGLILYALYFGWAFLALLFQLVEKIERKLNVRFLIPIVTVCAMAVLLARNVPAIIEMVNFGMTYYPA